MAIGNFTKPFILPLWALILIFVGLSASGLERTFGQTEIPASLKTRVSAGQEALREAHRAAEKELPRLESLAEGTFRSEKQNLEEKRLLKSEALRVLQDLAILERQIRPAYQSLNAENRQFEPCLRKNDQVQEVPAAHAFMAGPDGCVALHSGEIILSATDIALQERGGLAFSFVRTYRSNLDYSGPLGNGWDHNQNLRIVGEPDSSNGFAKLTLWNGTQAVQFTKAGEFWESEAGHFLRLEFSEDETEIRVSDSQLTTFLFEKALKPGTWRIAKIISRIAGEKNSLTYSYHPQNGLLRSVTDPYGNEFRFSYTPQGRIAWVAGADQLILFEYDSNGNLIQTKVPSAALGIREKTDSVTHFRFEDGRLAEFRGSNDALSAKFTFDPQGRAVTAGTFNESGTPAQVWKFQYSDSETTVEPPQPQPKEIYRFQPTIQHASLPVRKEIPAHGAVWTYQFNPQHQLTEMLTPDGQKEIHLYDSENPDVRLRQNLIQEAALGNGSGNGLLKEFGKKILYVEKSAFPAEIQYYEISSGGEERLLGRETFTYTDEFLLAQQTAFTIPTRFYYSPNGQPALTQHADGSCTIYRYGRKFPQTADTLKFTEGTLTGDGLCVQIQEDADTISVRTAARELGIQITPNEETVNQKTQIAYNLRGETVMEQTDLSTVFLWKNRAGESILAYDSSSGMVLTQFNENFQKIRVLRSLSSLNTYRGVSVSGFRNKFVEETFEYDDFGHVFRWTQTPETFGEDAKRPVWEYERTPAGLLLAVKNPLGVRRVMLYDSTGRHTETYLENGTKKAILLSDCTYSPEGRLLSSRNNHGAESRTEYDVFGREWKSLLPDGTHTVTERDGLGREIGTRHMTGEKVLARERTFYAQNGLPCKTETEQIFGNESRTFTAAETVYDARGRKAASRNAQKDSWTIFLCDALGRTIGELSPTEDVSVTCFRNGNPIYLKQIERNAAEKTLHSSGTIQLCDDFGTQWLTLPVDENGEILPNRAVIQHTDASGNVILRKSPGISTTLTSFNSLNQNVLIRSIPESSAFGEQDILTEIRCDAAGNLISRTTQNQALAIYGSQENASVKFESAPQTSRCFYDALGRASEEIQPDGLRVSKNYDSSSLIREMKWTGLSGKLLRHLEFQYDSSQRLTEIRDVLRSRTVRRFEYDQAGNLAKAVDLSGEHEISVLRHFDSTKVQRVEELLLDGESLPVKNVSLDPVEGTHSLHWTKFIHSRPYWSEMTLKTDTAGRFTGMELNGRSFCEWKFQGKRTVERKIPESQMLRRVKLNAAGEIESLRLGEEKETKAPWIHLNYMYGKRGEVEVQTSRIRDSRGRVKESAQYFQYDSQMNLTSQNQDEFLPEKPLERRNQLFQWGTEIVSAQTFQMRYDQAGNVWTSFRGMPPAGLNPGSIPAKNAPTYNSSASILPDIARPLTEAQLAELASNRCSASAFCKNLTSSKLEARQYRYDELGCLTEFDGTFTGAEKQTKVRWYLTWDVFGRLESMKAHKLDGETEGPMVAELHFAYDAFNRRILKEVHETERPLPQKTAVLYERNHPCLILKRSEIGWRVLEQYLWGIESQELLMCVSPEDLAMQANSSRPARYFLHQDRGFSVIAATKTVGTETKIVNASSYLAFGENASTADIEKVSSSCAISNPESCFDRHLDDGTDTIFSSSEENPFIEIQLQEPANLEYLKIHSARQFPAACSVYLIPGEEPAPTSNSIERWKEEHSSWCVFAGKLPQNVELDSPVLISLAGKRAQRILLTWDETLISKVSVREFQVGIQPERAGSVAFAGQWLDVETGLYYQLNRYRLPELSGKFISPDPLGFTDGINFYAYAHNNPLTWHDPDGEFAHILIGAAIGGIINGGFAIFNAWMNGEDFTDWHTWAHIGVSTLSGSLAGAVGAATFGAVSPLLVSTWGGTILSAGIAGSASGVAHGMLNSAGHSLLNGESLSQSLLNGVYAAAEEGIFGFMAGGIAGGLNSVLPLGIPGAARMAISGTVGGGATGGIYGAYAGYRETGTLEGALAGAKQGMKQGALYGGTAAMGAYAVGHLSGKWQPLPKQPKGIPNPRKMPGTLVKTKRPDNLKYGNLVTTPGKERHHIKPISLGGTDSESNIVLLDSKVHRQPHPGQAVKNAPVGTIFY